MTEICIDLPNMSEKLVIFSIDFGYVNVYTF